MQGEMSTTLSPFVNITLRFIVYIKSGLNILMEIAASGIIQGQQLIQIVAEFGSIRLPEFDVALCIV